MRSAAIALIVLISVLSCTKEKSGRKVQFKVTASEGVTIKNGGYTIGTASTNFSGSGLSWQSEEINIPDSVHEATITASGSVSPGYLGSLKAEIYVDGQLKGEKSGQSNQSTIIVYATSTF